ncbi:MAG: hypothetical protein WAZ99_04430 [Rectinemataceae bacterium]
MNEILSDRIVSVRPGVRRYVGPAWKDRPASGWFESGRNPVPLSPAPFSPVPLSPVPLSPKPGPGRSGSEDAFRAAILALSREDEEIDVSDERGPIMFKDGLFQIDVENAEGAPGIDPNLKGLIDSILNP